MQSGNVPLAFNNSVLHEFNRKLPQGSKWLVKRVSSNQRIRLSVGYKEQQSVFHSAQDLEQFIQQQSIEISDEDKRRVLTVIQELGELFNKQSPPTPPPAPARPAPSPAARPSSSSKSKSKQKSASKAPAASASASTKLSAKSAAESKPAKRQTQSAQQTQGKTLAKPAPAKTAPAKAAAKTAIKAAPTSKTAQPEVKSRKRAMPINAVSKADAKQQAATTSQAQPSKKRKSATTTTTVATKFASSSRNKDEDADAHDDDDAVLPGGGAAQTELNAIADEGSSDFDDDPHDAIAAFAASALALQGAWKNKSVSSTDATTSASTAEAAGAAGGNSQGKKRRRTTKGSMSITELAQKSETYEPLLRHFEGAHKGARGIKTAMRKHATRGSLVPRPADLEKFARQQDAEHEMLNYFYETYEQKFEEWLWLLHCDFNILLYGVGDKSSVISSFASELLMGEDVIEITNRNGTGDPRALLDFISSNILRSDFRTSNILQYAKQVTIALARLYNSDHSWFPTLSVSAATTESTEPAPTASATAGESSVTDNASEKTFDGDNIWLMPTRRTRSHYRDVELAVEEEIKSRPDSRKLFLLLHDLSAPAWHSQEAQLVLSTLASGRSVAIVAAFENVNLPSQWTHRMLDQFRWVFQHVPTYKHLRSSLRATSADITGGMHQQGLEFVLRSLTRRHLEILNVLADHQLTADGSSAMPYAALFEACKKQIITQTDAQLRHFLVELRDQKLIVMSHGKDGKETVKIPLQADLLQQIKSTVAR